MTELTVVVEVPGMTAGQYDETIRRLAAEGLEAPQGRLSHVAGPSSDGWLVVGL